MVYRYTVLVTDHFICLVQNSQRFPRLGRSKNRLSLLSQNFQVQSLTETFNLKLHTRCPESSDSDRPAQTLCTGDIDVCAMTRSHRYWNVHEGVLGDIVACTGRSVDAVAVSLAPARGNPKASECSSKPAVHVTDGAVVPPGHTNPGGHGVADRDSDELLHTKSAATSAVQTVTRSSRYGKESSVRNTP